MAATPRESDSGKPSCGFGKVLRRGALDVCFLARSPVQFPTMNDTRFLRRWCPISVALLTLVAAVRAENWPAWRGQNHDGVSAETHLPAEWSETKNVVWKAALPGLGSATPCVWGDHIFLTSEEGEDLVLLCFGTDGRQQWKAKVGAAQKGERSGEGNGATPSPSTDGKLVFAYVGSGDFAAFDLTGKEVWKFNAQERYGKFSYGFGMHTTPLLHEGRLYLQLIHAKAALVVALDAATGKEIWKVDRPSDGHSECLHSYASPALWKNGGDARLITHGNDYAIAHNLANGAEVWRVADLNPKGRYNATLRFVAWGWCTISSWYPRRRTGQSSGSGPMRRA